jgi:hypothetical protein
VGSVCRVKRFSLGGKRFADDEEVEKFSQGGSIISDDDTEVRNSLRQQSKDFYAASFDALVKRWDKRINVGGGYVEE